MAHHIYQTEGLVLRGFPEGDASRYVEIFTRELGLVGAHVRSVREERSKLRYAVQEYGTARISLVRGKQGWKMVNAVAEENFYALLKSHPRKLAAFIRIINLLRKLVTGEERNEELYAVFIGSLEFLSARDWEPDKLISIQIVAALRILHHLGYGVGHPDLVRLAGEMVWNEDVLSRASLYRVEAQRLIRASLSAAEL